MRKRMVGLSEEEQNSMQIPPHMRCDACHAIAHKLTTNIRETERKHGKGKNVQKRLRVDQYEQSFEDTCKDQQFWGEYYGVTHGKDGHNYFNGPGLTVLPKTLHKAQTLSMETTLRRGGMWSHRMREFCEQMVYSSEEDLDESEMYSILYESTPTMIKPEEEEESRDRSSGSDSSDSSSSPPPPKRIIINKDTRTFRKKMCARTCKKFPTRRPTTMKEELESGWEPFDEDAFTEKKRAQRKEDEAYRQAHKLVEDLTSGRGDGGEL